MEHAKNLHKYMTAEEHRLWGVLSGNQVVGFKIRRQHPIGRYVFDFNSHPSKVVVESNGPSHGDAGAEERDQVRNE